MGADFLPMTGLVALTRRRLRSLVRELAVDELEKEYDGEHERRGVMQETKVERRQHTRYAVEALVEVLVADGSLLFRGRVLDISVAGCYIETEARLRMRQRTPVEMVFRLKNVMFRIQATSRMVRPGKGAGFLFESLNETMRAELEALIAELSLPVAG
jgi:hypothetical protein